MHDLIAAGDLIAASDPSAMAEVGWFLIRYFAGMAAVMAFIVFLAVRVPYLARRQREEREAAMLHAHRSGAWWRAHGFGDIEADIEADIKRWERGQ
jgi:hypothetical protein